MRREKSDQRPRWREIVEAQGLTFHTRSTPYWTEDAAYAFTLDEIETLERAANSVHELYLDAAQHVIDHGLYDRLRIPDGAATLIERSWDDDELHLYGRFDFLRDECGTPKLLEYNADTPTSLLEAAVVQWYWLKDTLPTKDQLNSLHEGLIDRWRELGLQGTVHFAALEGNEEDVMTVEYLRDTAMQSGLATEHIPIERIGHDGRAFVDEREARIKTLFKLYPWEWMMHEEYGKHIASSGMRCIEPPWKMLWSNKAMLPILWERNKGHPNLVETSFEDDILGDTVRKPVYSREGANVSIAHDGIRTATDGEYGEEGFVYQSFVRQPAYDGKHPVLGLWMIGDVCRGMGIRESDGLVTDNTSRFVPHYIE
jgi:glutathionylspermidine synthase